MKHLELKERWLQDFVQEGKVQIRKEPASTNMADLGTKALSGPRIHELARMLPLRRGFMAAILASCIQMAGAQPQQQQESNFDIASFWMYVIVLHLLAVYGLIQLAGKLARFCRRCCDRTAVATRSVETQTDSHRQQVVENPEPSREVAGSPAPKRRAATSTTPNRSSARAVQETTLDAHTAEGLRPRGRREEISLRREKDQRRMEELQRMQLEERVFATVRGCRYHKDTCGDLRKARMSNPQGIVELSRQESQRCGYTACGNRGG